MLLSHSHSFLFFIQVLSITCCISLSIISGSSTKYESEYETQLLLKLKQQWNTSLSVQSWNASVSPCKWSGIQCSNHTITNISLPGQNISARIPSLICDLPDLSLLNLSDNSIPGGFPTVLYNCSRLQILLLSGNNFQGPLPRDIYKLSNLQVLFIGDNSFTGDIPIEFGRLKKLNYLYMRNCNLVGHIPPSFANFSSLILLDLENNSLTGSIPSALFQLTNLTQLCLVSNNLSGGIPNTIEALNLVQLGLSDNNLSGSIPEDLGKLSKLQKLYLFDNKLSGQIPTSFANLSSLKDLQMSKNKLVGVIPEDLGKLQNLETLTLSNNQLTGPIPRTISNLLNLIELQMDNNILTGSIPRDIGKLPYLQRLTLSQNQLYGSIPKSLVECKSLQYLFLDHNRLTGDIPLKLWILPNILHLSLQNNKLSGKFPSQLSKKLNYLNISNNNFSGLIPSSGWKWETLNKFFASNNNFKGTIPIELTTFSNLNHLQLDGNLLSGDLPSKIISWKSLTYLDFSRNNLSGSLPIALGSLPNLKDLNLSHNKLSGQIPYQLGLILDKLDLSWNNLSGKIPSIFDKVEYNTSFLNNPKLCSNYKVLSVPTCPSSRYKYVILISIIGGPVFILIVCFTFLFKGFGYGKENQSSEKKLIEWELKAFHNLEFRESQVVSGLIEDNVIGSGGSGKVYRIEIDDCGEKVAVKKIQNNKKSRDSLEKQFLAEVEILGRIRHANIVKLWCCISSDESKLLVYEYLVNECLDNWLHRTSESSLLLDWPTRLRIAIGSAKGLTYMHHGCSPPIIHRDIKSSNILLDSEFNAKIADFGLAKISMNKTGEPYTASAVAGSFGYMAPEYTSTRRLNEKIDVYSFGVVLLELSTGKEPRRGNDYMNLADWSQRHYSECYPIEDALDEQIKEPRYMEEMKNVFKLGVMCTRLIPSSRPSMREVSELLISFKQEEPEVSDATLTENGDHISS